MNGWHLSISENGDFHFSGPDYPTVLGVLDDMEMMAPVINTILEDQRRYKKQAKERQLANLREQIAALEADLKPACS